MGRTREKVLNQLPFASASDDGKSVREIVAHNLDVVLNFAEELGALTAEASNVIASQKGTVETYQNLIGLAEARLADSRSRLIEGLVECMLPTIDRDYSSPRPAPKNQAPSSASGSPPPQGRCGFRNWGVSPTSRKFCMREAGFRAWHPMASDPPRNVCADHAEFLAKRKYRIEWGDSPKPDPGVDDPPPWQEALDTTCSDCGRQDCSCRGQGR